jgi:hypothetical protein
MIGNEHLKRLNVRVEIFRKLRDKKSFDRELIFRQLQVKFDKFELEREWNFFSNEGWFSGDSSGNYFLNESGHIALSSIEKEYNRITKRGNWDIKLDRYNKYGSLLAVLISAFALWHSCNQSDKNKKIEKLQEKQKTDSLLFSNTLSNLQNQSVQHKNSIQNIQQKLEKRDSLFDNSKLTEKK